LVTGKVYVMVAVPADVPDMTAPVLPTEATELLAVVLQLPVGVPSPSNNTFPPEQSAKVLPVIGKGMAFTVTGAVT